MMRFLALSLSVLLTGTTTADDVFLDPGKFDRGAQEVLKLAAGAEPGPLTREQEAAVKAGARYVIYRLTEKNAQTKPGGMKDMVQYCEYWFRNVYTDAQARNTTLQQEFRKAVLAELDVVLSNPQQSAIVRLNAARVLAMLGDLSKHEETAELMVKVLDDPQQNDGARYYALNGLGELIARLKPAGIKDASRKEKVAQALSAFVERKPSLSAAPEPEELAGQKVLRREAVQALAQVREPVLGSNAKTRTAVALARVLRRDVSLVPDPRLDEQVEAAVGLAQLKADPAGDYQPAVAAYHLAAFLREFTRAYQERKDNRNPWRVWAIRVSEALNVMAATFPGDPTVKTVVQMGREVLERVEKGQAPNQGTLNTWVTSNKPQVAALYKSDPKSTAEPRNDEATKEEK